MKKLATLIATGMIAASGIAMADTPISQAEMERTFKGTTFNTEDFGSTGTMTFGADGTLTLNLKTVQDTGTYRFANGGYCSTWTKLRTTEACFTARRISDKQIRLYTADGKEDALLTMQ